MDQAWWDAFTREQWMVGDSRTGKPIGLECFPSEYWAARTIEGYVARDARGKRQDIHHLVPFMVPVRTR